MAWNRKYAVTDTSSTFSLRNHKLHCILLEFYEPDQQKLCVNVKWKENDTYFQDVSNT